MDDVTVAKSFVNKAKNAAERGISFELTFAQFKRIYSAKTCFYTGIELTEVDSENRPKFTTRTLDRIDSSQGYIKGNVVACCNGINAFKGQLEDKKNLLTPEIVYKTIDKWNKHLNTVKE